MQNKYIRHRCLENQQYFPLLHPNTTLKCLTIHLYKQLCASEDAPLPSSRDRFDLSKRNPISLPVIGAGRAAINGQWEVREDLLGDCWEKCLIHGRQPEQWDSLFSSLSHGGGWIWHLELLQPSCYPEKEGDWQWQSRHMERTHEKEIFSSWSHSKPKLTDSPEVSETKLSPD